MRPREKKHLDYTRLPKEPKLSCTASIGSQRSAATEGCKVATMTADVKMRLKNMSTLITQQKQEKIVRLFMDYLTACGYSWDGEGKC